MTVLAYKFLVPGRLAPFTGFRWPPPSEWVSAPADRPDAWVHACRPGDLPHWLAKELWRIELDEPVRQDRFQIAAPRARLVARVPAWGEALAREYAQACALRARDLSLPHLSPALREALAGLADLAAIAAAVDKSAEPSRAAGFVSDAAQNAIHVGPATTSYVAAVLASSLGGGLAAFEAERAWQARWLGERLGLGAAPS